MNGLIALLLIVLAAGLAAGALPTAGFWWDLLAALGYCAFALVAFMGWDSESPAKNPRLKLHRNLAMLGTTIAACHAIGYLIIDQTVIEYLLPAAPAYMLMGILAFMLLLGMTVSSLPGPRRKTYSGFPAFRNWHRMLFLLLLISTGWHVMGTDFSLGRVWQAVVLGILLGGAPVAAYWARRTNQSLPMTPEPGSEAAADRHPILIGLLMLLLSATFAGIKVIACDVC